mgnify:CR=1 FL=1
MTWLCSRDCATQPANSFVSPLLEDIERTHPLLAKGTILVEIDIRKDGRIPARLIHYKNTKGWARRFTIFLNPDHSLSIETQQGLARSYVHLKDWKRQSRNRLRLTYAWDAPARLGLLTLECLETGRIDQALFDAPVPLPVEDVKAIADNNDTCHIDQRVVSLSIANSIEPVGPSPSIAAGTMVETEHGLRPIDRLQLGDTVLTTNSGLQPIRWILRQDLPAVGSYRPIRLRAPYFGLQSDITVSRNQRIMVSGAEAEYHFGQDAVLIEAQELLGHPSATLHAARFTTTYYQVLLDNHDCIQLNGTWSESLFVGNLARSPQVLATSRLAELPRSAMPVHNDPIRPTLQPFETQTLLESISA